MIAVSACLVGVKCRYDGKTVAYPEIMKLYEAGQLLPICPEVLGGLPIPRPSCEIIKMHDHGTLKVCTAAGEDKTEAFRIGAEKTLAVCQAIGIRKAILKSKSPSCGRDLIYDGTFTGHLVEGNGLTAALLMANGIEVIGEHCLCLDGLEK